MKYNLRRLNALSKMIDLSMFYSIRVSEHEVRLQGEAVDKDELLKHKFTVNEDDLAACDLIRGKFQVVIL